MNDKLLTLKDYSSRIVTPTLVSAIKSGALDYAIQQEDCQDIIAKNPELKAAVEKRLEILYGTS